MSDRNLYPSRHWLFASAVAAMAAVATPVLAFDFIVARADASVLPIASAPVADIQDPNEFDVIRDGISHRYTVQGGVTFRVLADGTRRAMTAAERREVAHHRRAMAQARRHILSQEAHIRRQEDHIREQEAHVREQTAHIRNQLALAADQFTNGARQLREEADRRRDPAHRARELEKTRLQGETLTDQQLIDSIPQLRQSADGMDREAEKIRASMPPA